MIPIVLNLLQIQAISKLKEINTDKGIIVMPTGTGKTYLASYWFKQKLKENPTAKLLFICHSKDILSQANETEFQVCLEGLGIDFKYYSGINKEIGQATFGTTQTLANNLNKFSKDFFDYIIVDEAHHYQANTFKKVLKYFKPKFMLSLTATPNRTDGLPLTDICGNIISHAKTYTAIKNNILCPFHYYSVEHNIDLDKVKFDKRGYNLKDLNKKICIPEYDKAILEQYKEYRNKYKRKKTIAFCSTIEHAYRMNKVFNDNGISSNICVGNKMSSISGIFDVSNNDKERTEAIEGFKSGKYEVIFTVNLFNEGINVPNCDCILLLRPTLSSIVFTQQIGRGLRKAEGKDYLLILDFIGNHKRCGIDLECLSEMTGLDIQKEINKRTHTGNLHGKDNLTLLSIGCKIHFTKKKVELFRKSLKRTKEDFIDNYIALKKQLKRIPKMEELTKFMNESEYSILKFFKTYRNLKKICGDKEIERWKTKKELIELYKKMKKNKEIISSNEFFEEYKDLGVTRFNIRLKCGNWQKFVKSCGDIYSRPNTHYKGKKDLIDKYFALKKRLNRVPTTNEFTQRKILKSRFNLTYSEFLKRIVKEKDLSILGRSNFGRLSIEEKLKIAKKKYFALKKRLNKITLTSGDCKKTKGLNSKLADLGGLNAFKIKFREPYYKQGSKKLIFPKKRIYKKYKKVVNKLRSNKKNVLFEQRYIPINKVEKSIDLVNKVKRTLLKQKRKPLFAKAMFHSTKEKNNIRPKIINYMKDGDVILLLESPELSALKEIEFQNKKPKKIIIPNNFEFRKVAYALNKYKTKLNIELINTSVLQYLVDTDEKFDWIWLDYCGAFEYYKQDLDVLLKKHKGRNMNLFLTYNIFDVEHKDTSWYFAKVIDYVLARTSKTRLYLDTSNKYKKMFYNLGVKTTI